MGQLLNKSSEGYDVELIHDLRPRDLKELGECIQIINQDYENISYLNYSQFDDIFCGFCNDCEPYFLMLQNDHAIGKTVDMYESLGAFAIFCGDIFPNKLRFIFHLFDFDKSNTIELTELVMTLQSVIRALCKFVNLPIPTLKEIEDLSYSIFSLIDHDNNKKLTFDEFKDWVCNSIEIQDFLLRYTGTQTMENLSRRRDMIMANLKFFFDHAAGQGKDIAKASEIRSLIEKDSKYSKMDPATYDFLFNLLINTTDYELNGKGDGKSVIRSVYVPIMKAWSSFSAADADGEESICIKEFPNLLWAFEGKQCGEIRVAREIKQIDVNGSEFIDRIEWLSHFSGIDKRTKKLVFRGNLKTLFDQYGDADTGFITLVGLKELFWNKYKSYENGITDAQMKKDLKDIITNLAISALEVADSSGDEILNWDEFKDFMDLTQEKRAQVSDYLDKNYLLKGKK